MNKEELEKRAKEYARKEVYYGAYVDTEAGMEIAEEVYIEATERETKLLQKRIAELEEKLEQTEKDLADYQFNYPTIKELQQENARLKEINAHTLSQLNLDNGELIIENEKLKKENAELKGEADKWLVNNLHSTEEDYKQAYLAGAEPREKEIKSLGERCLQLQKDKGELIDKVRDLEEKLANADYQLEGRDLEIKKLKAQIEKMKCCYNCANDTLEPPEVIGNGICEHCKNHDKWELEY